MNHKVILYAVIAGGTALASSKQPQTSWEWVLLVTAVAVQIANALKALFSMPPQDEPPAA